MRFAEASCGEVTGRSVEEIEQIAIHLNGLEHHYDSRQVFANIQASFRTSQVGIVTGLNGSGKSTLFRIIAGLLSPSRGSVDFVLHGKPQNSFERRRHIGLIAPDMTLYRELTAVENLLFFAEVMGRTVGRSELVELLTEVGLRGRGRDLVGNYSSGMRQRLKYALALMSNPPVLLLDEPTANLDVSGLEMVERVIARQKVRNGGGLTLVATNEPRELEWGEVQVRLEPTS